MNENKRVEERVVIGKAMSRGELSERQGSELKGIAFLPIL